MKRYRIAVAATVVLAALVAFAGRGEEPGALTFELDRTYRSASTFQIGLADIDADGDLDAIVANMAGPSEVWRNDGSGRFVDTLQRLASGGHGVGLGDFDGDGDVDVFLVRASIGESSRVYLNDGAGRFSDTGQQLIERHDAGNFVSIIDVDGDGDLDAAVYYSGRFNVVYHNDGTGRFADAGSRIPGFAAWGDIDGDGCADAVSLELSGAVVCQHSNGDGTFSEIWRWPDAGASFLPGNARLGDLDGDGDLDLLFCRAVLSEEPLVVLLNDGTGGFAPHAEEQLRSRAARVSLADVNGDGSLDVLLARLERPVAIGLNDGTGRFIDSGLELGGDVMNGVSAIGDLDGDSDLDLFIAVYGSSDPNEVWLNGTR